MDRGAGGHRVGDFAERDLDGLLVAREHDRAIRLGDPQPRAVPPEVEDRLADLGHERPSPASAAEQPRQAVAGRPAGRGQPDGGKERRARGADVRVGADQPALGSQDVGTIEQHRGRHAGLEVGQRRRRSDRRVGQKRVGNRSADEQVQRVAVLGDEPGEHGDVAARRLHARARPLEVERRGGAGLLGAPRQLEGPAPCS